MGLDGVELIMAAEEAFDITITDAEAEHVITVDDFYQLILSKLEPHNNNRCLTAVTFYLLRRELADALHVELRSIRRDTNLNQLIPVEQRKALWEQMTKKLELQLPELIRSDYLNKLIVGMPLLTTGVSVVSFLFAVVVEWQAIALVMMGVGVTYLLVIMTRPLKQHIANNIADLGEMARAVLLKNLTLISKNNGGVNHEEVYNLVLNIISEQLFIPLSDIDRHHSFVDDLGMD